MEFEGIRYIVSKPMADKSEISKRIMSYARGVPAVGLVEIDQDGSSWSIVPNVYVKDMGKIVAETACGSGSIAAALDLYHRGIKKDEYKIRQPGGSVYSVAIKVLAGKPKSFTLSGPVDSLG